MGQDEEAYNRVISIRGRAGAVLGLEPSAGETGAHIAECLKRCLPSAGLVQVEHIASDAPSNKLFTDLKMVCPNLRALSLDPTHAAMSTSKLWVERNLKAPLFCVVSS